MKNYIKISDFDYREVLNNTELFEMYDIAISGADNYSIYSKGGIFVGYLTVIDGKTFALSGKSKRVLSSLNNIKIISVLDRRDGALLQPHHSLYKDTNVGPRFYKYSTLEEETLRSDIQLEETMLWERSSL